MHGMQHDALAFRTADLAVTCGGFVVCHKHMTSAEQHVAFLDLTANFICNTMSPPRHTWPWQASAPSSNKELVLALPHSEHGALKRHMLQQVHHRAAVQQLPPPAVELPPCELSITL
jgi:hypothetical protein